MSPPKPRLAVLTYLSRSGSTFLAERLARLEGCFVSLEARVPDGIIHPPPALQEPASAAAFLDRLYADEKFRAWGVPREELAAALAELPFPLGLQPLLRLLLERAAAPEKPALCIYKKGHYLFHLEALRQRLPEARVLVLLRDPRGVYNSQKRAVSSRGERMALAPPQTGRLYRRAMAALAPYRGAPWLHIVRYEDLLDPAGRAWPALLEFLELAPAERPAGDYAERIPPEQRHLHLNVGGAPLRQRAEAWRRELSPAEIHSLQRTAGEALAAGGYAAVPCERVPAAWHLRHAAWRAIEVLNRLRQGLRRARPRAG